MKLFLLVILLLILFTMPKFAYALEVEKVEEKTYGPGGDSWYVNFDYPTLPIGRDSAGKIYMLYNGKIFYANDSLDSLVEITIDDELYGVLLENDKLISIDKDNNIIFYDLEGTKLKNITLKEEIDDLQSITINRVKFINQKYYVYINILTTEESLGFLIIIDNEYEIKDYINLPFYDTYERGVKKIVENDNSIDFIICDSVSGYDSRTDFEQYLDLLNFEVYTIDYNGNEIVKNKYDNLFDIIKDSTDNMGFVCTSNNCLFISNEYLENNHIVFDSDLNEISRFTGPAFVVWAYPVNDYIYIMENNDYYAYKGDKYLYKYLFKQDKINEQTEKINIKKRKKISAIFPEIVSLKNITFKIVNEGVLKIENGEIIPLKVGNTDIEFKYNGKQYILHVFITENDLINIPDTFKNPNTGTGISIIIIFMLIISSITYIIFKRKKNYIIK